MLTDFDKFCLNHCCARDCANRPDYCPIAEEVTERYGGISGRFCEMTYNEKYKTEGEKA